MLNVSPSDVWLLDRQQHRVDQVADVRVVDQPIAPADELHLAALDLLDEAGQGVPVAGAIDDARPQDHRRKTVLADVVIQQNLGLGLGPRVAVEADGIRRQRFIGAVVMPGRINAERADLHPPLEAAANAPRHGSCAPGQSR